MIDQLGDLGSMRLVPECQGQAPAQNLGILRRGANALHGLGDVLGFTEIFLREAAALAMFPAPEGIIVVGVAVNGFGFEPMHAASFS